MASPSSSLSVADLIQRLGGDPRGDRAFPVLRFRPLAQAGASDAAFAVHERMAEQVSASRAGLMILPPSLAQLADRFKAAIVVADPYLYFAQVAGLIQASNRAAQVQETQVHPSAVVAQTAKLGQRVRISAGVVIEEGAEIGDDTDIGPGCVIGAHSRIGAAGLLHARVSLGAGVQIGQRVVIQSGAVLGSDGFGYAPNADRHWVKIPQVGGVVIGDDVEIGANTVIDQGTMSPTRIGHGVKLDNLIQVAHNVEIGDHTAIAGCVGIAGSAKIGRYCQIGGAAGILGHLQIADGTIIGPMSLVMSSIETAGKYVGVMPLAPERQWEKSAAIIRRLPEMRRSLSRLGQVVGLQRDPTTDA
ncbi:MAG: UDP-3-O-(3-hydroxymyristoyl)glucosamine N-acyltransferase [Burkholderiaceae bacterium]